MLIGGVCICCEFLEPFGKVESRSLNNSLYCQRYRRAKDGVITISRIITTISTDERDVTSIGECEKIKSITTVLSYY